MVNGAFMVLKGHRSIVNQVRFNPHTYMICSSGVEKIIKVSFFSMVRIFSFYLKIGEALRSRRDMLWDLSTKECYLVDPRKSLFFHGIHPMEYRSPRLGECT